MTVSMSSSSLTVFYNAKIYTGDKAQNVARWMAIEKGKVVSTGAGSNFSGLKPARRVDLKGRVVLPGLTDSHAHITELGKSLMQADLSEAKSAEQAASLVRAFIEKEKLSATDPVIGHSWNQEDWGDTRFPDRRVLDAVSDHQPIILYRKDLHALWVNTFALKHSSLWKLRENPAGGLILRDKEGLPSGVLIDKAMVEIEALIPPPSDRLISMMIERAVRAALELGITSIHSATATHREIETLRKLLRDRTLRFRYYGMITSEDPAEFEGALKKSVEIGSENGQLTVRTVKLFADGAMGSRGAAFDLPYDDDPGNTGLMVHDPTKLAALISRIDQRGFQLAIHAIGSKATRIVLDALEKALGKNAASRRPRIEHAQVLDEADIARMKSLGVVASMQPIHCSSDMPWVEKRIGAQRSRFAYAWRSILKAGIPLAFGSDSPVESLNPWQGMLAAVRRQSLKGSMIFHPEEQLTLREAFQAYTTGAAFAAFAENEMGSLEPGKWADFIILTDDPFSLPPEKLGKARVTETYVGGERVYGAK